MRRTPRNIPCVADFDPTAPSIARVYDYFLGGRDNFAADRELAQRLIDIFPPIPVTVRENKQFLDRAVTVLAGGTPCVLQIGGLDQAMLDQKFENVIVVGRHSVPLGLP